MGSDSTAASKEMSLRYEGRCRVCGATLAAGTRAVYFRDLKSVECVPCFRAQLIEESAVTSTRCQTQVSPGDTESPNVHPCSDAHLIDAGSAGASAQREYERRKRKREDRVREAHPRIGGFLLAITDEPQSTKAWGTGATGEMVLGRRLDGLVNDSTFVLHDRRIPPTRANIDHIVVSSSGVFVIDAKKYKGRPSLRVDGGFFRPRVERLMVGSRDRTKLVDGVNGQVSKVRAALAAADLGDVPVTGMLCFVEADWPLFGGDFSISDVRVLWPKKAASEVAAPVLIGPEVVRRTFHTIAEAFPVS
jgi:hypothetical protein